MTEFDPTELLTEDEVLDLYLKRSGEKSTFPFASLEDLLTSELGFGLKTATPLQRAICRAIEGKSLGDLWNDPAVRRSFGDSLPPERAPAEVVIVAGVRTAKSMLAAANAIWASQTCDLSLLSPGEIPRYSVLSLEKDNARVVMGHLLGVLGRPALIPFRVDLKKEKGPWTRLIDEIGADDVIGSEFLRHPSGRPVEIRVIAGKRAGGSLVSRWSVGCALDEAPRMVGSDDAVINYEDARNAVITRLLPGAQLFSLGSPWQPYGPIYDIVQTEFGSPTDERVVIKARGSDMNPFWWTPERCEKIRKDPRNKMSYQTDVLAEFADAEEAMFPQALLQACSRKNAAPLPFEPGHTYVAAMDPATRGNAWTLVVADRLGAKKRVVFATQWIGSSLAPLRPKDVLGEAAGILKPYGLDWCYTDQWAADALRDIASDVKLSLVIEEIPKAESARSYGSLAQSMAQGLTEIPNDPQFHKDFKLVKRRPVGGGFGYTVNLPVTPDGRHCDYAPATVLALRHWIDEEHPVALLVGAEGYEKQEMDKIEAREVEEFARKQNTPWWAGGISDDFDNLESGDMELPEGLG